MQRIQGMGVREKLNRKNDTGLKKIRRGLLVTGKSKNEFCAKESFLLVQAKSSRIGKLSMLCLRMFQFKYFLLFVLLGFAVGFTDKKAEKYQTSLRIDPFRPLIILVSLGAIGWSIFTFGLLWGFLSLGELYLGYWAGCQARQQFGKQSGTSEVRSDRSDAVTAASTGDSIKENENLGKAVEFTKTVVEGQIKLASEFCKAKGRDPLPDQLPLNDYSVSYAVGFVRGTLIQLNGGEIEEAEDWAAMVTIINEFFGSATLGDPEELSAVKHFLDHQNSDEAQRGQRDGGSDAMSFSGNDPFPKALASYLLDNM
jgi:hypothetical protein